MKFICKDPGPPVIRIYDGTREVVSYVWSAFVVLLCELVCCFSVISLPPNWRLMSETRWMSSEREDATDSTVAKTPYLSLYLEVRNHCNRDLIYINCFLIDVAGGFTGVYDPDPDDVVDLFTPSLEPVVSSRRRRRAVSAYVDPADRLALNGNSLSDPLTCLELGSTMLWSITETYYPRYDKQNLWNSNPVFDHGKFDELDTNQRLTNSNLTLFTFRFTEGGTYAFKMDNETDNRMVRHAGFTLSSAHAACFLDCVL